MSNKVVLITGASSGIGYEAAKQLAAAGHKVYAAARRVERMDDLKPLGVVPVALDVTREADNAAVVARILDAEGRLDVLINNAGFGLYGPVEDVSLADARYQFDVNLFGLAHLTQLVLPQMRAQGAGRIVNVSSMGGRIFTPMGAWYHATKHALEGWSDSLRIEVAPFGIGVVLIEPGGVKTEWGPIAFESMRKYAETSAYKDQIAAYLRRVDSPDASLPGTAPEVLARTFVRAATAPRPKRRYLTGLGAKQFVFIRRWFGDGVYEGVLRLVFR